MKENREFDQVKLASIVEEHFPESADSDTNAEAHALLKRRCDRHAVFIERTRALGASNFFLVDAESQLADIRQDVRSLNIKIKGLGGHADFLLLAAIQASNPIGSHPAEKSEFSEFIGLQKISQQLDLTLVALEWRARRMKPKPWKLARKRNWSVPSIANGEQPI